jgi:glycosyltransferase involved in cell wall biosynthesis
VSISVCIITKNEAENIAACIRSVAWADEIIVVDNFSEDNTPQIAESLGAKVYIEDWKGFGAQKNSAIHKASGDWILSLDADERVTDSLRIEIQQRLDLKNSVSGYYIPRKNYFCGKWIRYGGWYPDYSLRLFRKISGRFENRSVHEKVLSLERLIT